MMIYGAAQVWRAVDGKVYGRKSNTTFLCTKNEIVEGKTREAFIDTPDNLYGNVPHYTLNTEGNLIVEDQTSKEQRIVESTFEPSANEVFNVGDIYNGRLYGSGMKPGHIFTYDINTGKLDELGSLIRGRIQAYDIGLWKSIVYEQLYWWIY